jgi:hypothetical protein
MLIAVLAFGIVIGLALGVAVSPIIITPEKILCIINPVQVSGTVTGVLKGTIQFVNNNEAENTRYQHRAQIINGNYSILLSGGQTYRVYIGIGGITGDVPHDPYYVYIPSNVTTFTANFT